MSANLDFGSLNGVSKHLNADFYLKLRSLKTNLESGEPISTQSNPTPDAVIEKVQKINDDCAETLTNLRKAGNTALGIYEEVTKTTIGVAAGTDDGKGHMMMVQ